MNEPKIQMFLTGATMSERRRFVALTRIECLSVSDAQRVIERERNRAATSGWGVADTFRAQASKRLVVGAHELVTA